MAIILLAIYLIVGACHLVSDYRASEVPFMSKQVLFVEDLKETAKEPVKGKNIESDTEPAFSFYSRIKLLLFWTPFFKFSNEFLKPSPGFHNPTFAPPDLV